MEGRLRYGPDCIDGATHGQGRSAVIGQGEVHRRTSAVGGRRGGIPTRGRPETPHFSGHQGPLRRIGIGINAEAAAFTHQGVAHHEALHCQGAPAIKDGQAQVWVLQLQGLLRLEQPIHHPAAQQKGIAIGAVGRPQGQVGMGFQPPQGPSYGLQRLTAVVDRNRAPGTQGHGGRLGG